MLSGRAEATSGCCSPTASSTAFNVGRIQFAVEEVLGAGVSSRLSVTNLLDTKYRAFVGVPTTGRQLLTRLEYRLR
jgi:hypothetical protein